jgi:hypothetical protein
LRERAVSLGDAKRSLEKRGEGDTAGRGTATALMRVSREHAV